MPISARNLERSRIFWRGDRIEWVLARGYHERFVQDADGSELTDADLSDAERTMVERATRTLEIAAAMAATPDQIYPLARLLARAQIADEQASIRADMERLARPPGR